MAISAGLEKGNPPRLAIDFVVVNWNKSVITCNLVEQLCASAGEHRIIIVDNASETVQKDLLLGGLKRFEPAELSPETVNESAGELPRVSIIWWDSNSGYAGGNNVGLQLALRRSANRYAWVLNNDIEISEAGTIRKVAEFLARFQESDFALSPPVAAPDGKVRLACRRGLFGSFRTRMVERKDYRAEQTMLLETDHLVGCSLLFSKSVLWKVGLLDERFFLYAEETDWCYRCKAAGCKLYLLLTEPVYHDNLFRRETAPYQVYYKVRNSFLLISKHGPGVFAKIPWVAFRVAYALAIFLRFDRAGMSRKECLKALYRGFLDGLRGRFGRKEWQ